MHVIIEERRISGHMKRGTNCPFDLSLRLIVQIYFENGKQTHRSVSVLVSMVIVHRYLTQLHKPDPAKKRDITPVLVHCWGSVADDGSILNRHWINVSYLL